MQSAALGRHILVAQLEGDRPAIITRVDSNEAVEACGFMPLPERLRLVMLHEDRRAALNAIIKHPTVFHGYWPPKA